MGQHYRLFEAFYYASRRELGTSLAWPTMMLRLVTWCNDADRDPDRSDAAEHALDLVRTVDVPPAGDQAQRNARQRVVEAVLNAGQEHGVRLPEPFLSKLFEWWQA